MWGFSVDVLCGVFVGDSFVWGFSPALASGRCWADASRHPNKTECFSLQAAGDDTTTCRGWFGGKAIHRNLA